MRSEAKPKFDFEGVGVGALADAMRPEAADPSDLRTDWPRVPGYRLTRLIGEGGGGWVFEAVRDGDSEMRIAVKVVRQSVRVGPGCSGLERVWRELDVLAALRLASVPRVLDWGTCGERLFIVTELIEGRPLDEHCAQAGFGVRDRVRLLIKTCRAVASLHDALVIHRDLKPANILVDARGHRVILDFGLAKLLDAEPGRSITVTGELLGTTPYMAPESLFGADPGLRSVRADVYALGATAYVLLAGDTPRGRGTTVLEQLRSAVAQPTRDPRQLRPDLPRALGCVLQQACHHDPGRRYASAGELADDLERWLNGRPVRARRTTWIKASEWAAAHPILLTAGLCVAMVLVSVSSIAVYADRYFRQPYKLVQKNESGEAQLLSRRDTLLRTWRVETPGELVFAGQAKTGRGSQWVGVVALRSGSAEPSAGQLAMFRPDQPDIPFFLSGVGEPDFVRPTGAEISDRYRPAWAFVADVFPSLPGDEVIAVFNEYRWFPTCIRIYDTKGGMLFEAWHRGRLGSAQWLSKPGVLLLAGVTNRPEIHEATERLLGKPCHVPVVLAIVPVVNARRGWLDDEIPGQPSSVVAWYQYLQPLEMCQEFSDTKLQAFRDVRLRESRATVFAMGRPAVPSRHIEWTVTTDGRFEAPTVSDGLRNSWGDDGGSEVHWSPRFDELGMSGEQIPASRPEKSP